MKILIINPNSDPGMTADIRRAAEGFVKGQYEVVTLPTPGAPKFIDTYTDQAVCAPGMMQLLKENENAFDAFIVACHCDPNLDLLKEMTAKPVVGIGEASMKMASMMGHSFSVVSTGYHSMPNKEALIRKYCLEGCLASVRAPGASHACRDDKEKFLEAARLAVEEDMAEVIVLGCAGLGGLDKYISEQLHVPVLDGVICALIIAAGLAQYGVGTSKIRRYNPEG